MVEVTYEIVEHDGGWAYKVDGVFSETFPTHADALAAAQAAAEEQTVPGQAAGTPKPRAEPSGHELKLKIRSRDGARAPSSGEFQCFGCEFSLSRCLLR